MVVGSAFAAGRVGECFFPNSGLRGRQSIAEGDIEITRGQIHRVPTLLELYPSRLAGNSFPHIMPLCLGLLCIYLHAPDVIVETGVFMPAFLCYRKSVMASGYMGG